MQVQQFYDYTDMLKANLQSAITIGGKLQFKDEAQYNEFLDAGLIIGSLLVNTVSGLPVYDTAENTIWDAVEAKVTLWGGDPANDMNLRHLALVEILDALSAPDDILVQIDKVRVVAKFDVVDETKIQYGDQVYVQADPYTKNLVFAGWGSNIWRVFVDGELGDDLNDGLTWGKAKKTIKSALDTLPDNLLGYEARIVIHPGIYNENVEVSRFQNCPKLCFMAIGTFLNLEEEVGGLWNPDSVTIRSDEPVHIKGVGTEKSVLTGSWNAKDVKVDFEAADWTGGKTFNDIGYFLYDKFIIEPEALNTNAVLHMRNTSLNIDVCGIKIFLKDANQGIHLDGSESATIKALHVVGGTGKASGYNSPQLGWNAPIVANGVKSLLVGEYGLDYLRTKITNNEWDTPFVFEGVTHLLAVWDGSVVTSKFKTTTLTNLQGEQPTLEPLIIRLQNANISGKVEYDSTKITLVDNATNERYIKDWATGEEKSLMASNKMKFVGNNFIPKISTTVPADSSLGNTEYVFYMDETTETLKVKYKDSGGVIQTGDIAILT